MIRLSVHLFDNEVEGWDSALRSSEFDRQLPREGAPFDCILVTSVSSGQEPDWVEYLSRYFDVDWQPARRVALTLLVRVRGRIFAVTFGNGRHLLDIGRTVPDFGVRVTANWLTDDDVTAVGTRTLGLRGRQQLTKVSHVAPIREFNVDLELDWVCTLAGVTDDALARGMSGSQCLHLTPREHLSDFDQLDAVLAQLLDLYESTAYRHRFPFLDLLTPLRPTDSSVAELDATVLDLLVSRQFDELGLTQPEPLAELDEERIWRFRVTGTGRPMDTREDLTLSWLGYCAQLAGPTALDRVRLTMIDRDGHNLATRRLRQYLTTEITRHRNERYVLSLGRWFRVDRSFAERVEEEVGTLKEVRDLHLPFWERHQSETEYLCGIDQPGEFHVLDRQTVTVERPHGKVEICDLLTPDMRLIHVKKLRRSATLSHLFGQGAVSARLLATHDPTFWSTLDDAYRRAWPNRDPAGPSAVVFAIGVNRGYRPDAAVRELLPFFSKVNLAHHARDIERNFTVLLARVDIVEHVEHVEDVSSRIPTRRSPARPSDFVQEELAFDDD